MLHVLAKSFLSYIIASTSTVLFVNMCFLSSLTSFNSDAIFAFCCFTLICGNLPSLALVCFLFHFFFVLYLMHPDIVSDYKTNKQKDNIPGQDEVRVAVSFKEN